MNAASAIGLWPVLFAVFAGAAATIVWRKTQVPVTTRQAARKIAGPTRGVT